MGLNVQPENVLSKEERKTRLGGKEPGICYVVCKGGRWYIGDDCDQWAIKNICGEEVPKCCGCWGTCYE